MLSKKKLLKELKIEALQLVVNPEKLKAGGPSRSRPLTGIYNGAM